MRRSFSLLLLLSVFASSFAQIMQPITWDFDSRNTATDEVELQFIANIEQGWHLYGMDLPAGGPIATTFEFMKVEGATLEGKIQADQEPTFKFDPQFDMKLNWFSNTVTFSQRIKLSKKNYRVEGHVRFMGCDDQNCLPPTPVEFTFTGTAPMASSQEDTTSTPVSETTEDPEVIKPMVSQTTAPAAQTNQLQNALWTPVIDQIQAFDASSNTSNASLIVILITGFLGGLLALLTPCVWPMIPMTVSFFLKRTKDHKKAIRDAVTYGLSIIVIYVALGLIITGVFGASALNDLATNAVFNILFFLLLVIFAVSFLGAFEITLPASWTTRLDSKADSTTGLLSIFFMAFTLALVSFSCTGPIIGTLLVQAASLGAKTGPAVGMFGFACALAIPFTLFAIFPSMLQSMPKSGGWLNAVKVTLGFLELALALKFLSVADLAYGWRILDRETFLTLWIVIFALLGLYLIGKLKFSHDSDLPHVTIPRLFLAIISFAFSIYMIPGLWGAPLKAISAFAPPLTTQDFNLNPASTHEAFDNYEEGMAFAKQYNKPVLLDFSGHGCVNCRKMEASVWTDPEVKSMIEQNYVLITLYVDDKAPLEKPITIEEYGKKRTLYTIGDKWSYLQRHKFGANAQPYYVLLNDEGQPLAPAYSFNESIPAYLQFLNRGLTAFDKQ